MDPVYTRDQAIYGKILGNQIVLTKIGEVDEKIKLKYKELDPSNSKSLREAYKNNKFIVVEVKTGSNKYPTALMVEKKGLKTLLGVSKRIEVIKKIIDRQNEQELFEIINSKLGHEEASNVINEIISYKSSCKTKDGIERYYNKVNATIETYRFLKTQSELREAQQVKQQNRGSLELDKKIRLLRQDLDSFSESKYHQQIKTNSSYLEDMLTALGVKQEINIRP